MSNLQPNCCLKFDSQKVDQHAGGKWLIHDTNRRKANQLQSLKVPCRILLLCRRMWCIFLVDHIAVKLVFLNVRYSIYTIQLSEMLIIHIGFMEYQ